MSRGVLFSHPIGAPFASAAVRSLHSMSLLSSVVTSFVFDKDSYLARVLRTLPSSMSGHLLRELERRAWLPAGEFEREMHPARELIRIGLERTKLRNVIGLRGQQLVDWVYRGIDEAVAARIRAGDHYRAVYAYEDGALCSFNAAKKRGMYCLYDLPIAYVDTAKRIVSEEAELYPVFSESLQSIHDSDEKARRKHDELMLADVVFVASSFTRRSVELAGVAPERIVTIPYGGPEVATEPRRLPKRFRIGFVGRVGPRKGVHYLIEAWKQVRSADVELEFVGIDECPPGWLKENASGCRYVSSLPHRAVLERLSQMSILVLPSLVEGFGMVLLEALALGVPIIATPHTAAPDLIEDGVEGFITPIRDAGALAEKISWCIEHTSELDAMSRAALECAKKHSWCRYEQELGSQISSLIT